MNFSDYDKSRLALHEQLPDVYVNPLVKSISETTVNRFLSKDESVSIYGTVGVRNASTRTDLQIKETSPHRQAYQLQPLLCTDIANNQKIASFEDIFNKLAILGVNRDTFDDWGSTEQFSWMPPITIDKFINYQDYVWHSNSGSATTPQYITIETPCSTATARYKILKNQLKIAEQGIKVVRYLDSNRLIVDGAHVGVFNAGYTIDIHDSFANNGTYNIVSSEIFNVNYTIVTLDRELPSLAYAGGTVSFSSMLTAARNTASLQCTGGMGWDVGGWDDFDNSIFWDHFGPYEYDTNPWSASNQWVHKSLVDNYNPTQVAKSPIIEFSRTIELNEWSEYKHKWQQFNSLRNEWEDSDREPTNAEISSVGFHENWKYMGRASSLVPTSNVERTPVDQRVIYSTLSDFNGNNMLTLVERNVIELHSSIQCSLADDEIMITIDGFQFTDGYHFTRRPDGTVHSVIFEREISNREVVNIHCYTQALADIGRERVLVRVGDEVTDTEYVSLTRYRRTTQSKQRNEIKYPLFNMYNVDGTHSGKVSPIFSYVRDENAGITSHLNDRVAKVGTDFSFQQHLLKVDKKRIYLYKDSSIDGELCSIWRPSNVQYIPQYVDDNRNPTTKNSISGDWQVPDQLYNNVFHENWERLTFGQLYEHMQSNIQSQRIEGVEGIPAEKIALMLDNSQYDYGAGGTIKEYNDSFDTLMSTALLDSVTMLDVLEFAKRQYQTYLNLAKEEFRSYIFNLLLDQSEYAINNLPQYVTDVILERLEFNDIMDQVSGDSTTYDPNTKIGMKNWITTLPYIGVVAAQPPTMLIDPINNTYKLRHHDGHVSTNFLTDNAITAIGTVLVQSQVEPGRARAWNAGNRKDPWGNRWDGNLSTIDPTKLYVNDFMFTGKELFRLKVITIVNSAIAELTHAEVGSWQLDEQGTIYYRAANGWQAIGPYSHHYSLIWERIDLNMLQLRVLHEIEQRLYEAAPHKNAADLKFSVADVVQTNEHSVQLYDTMKDMFDKYVNESGITDPMTSGFNGKDPFTWNYADVVEVNVPYGSPADWHFASWYAAYLHFFNTPYPNIEPWKLQGYYTKPVWWDAKYQGTDRMWTAQMWDDIRSGTKGQFGELLAQEYSFVPVNTTDNPTSDGYAPDELLPLFWMPPANPSTTDLVVANSVFIRTPIVNKSTIKLDRPFTFGMIGPVEQQWRQSITYNYDLCTTLFRMQPMRFVHNLLGVDFVSIAGLNVSTVHEKVYSHSDVSFHGELYDGSPLQFNGLLQWYVNYNRATGYDNDTSNFTSIWKDWYVKLGYQFDGMVDGRTLTVKTNDYTLDGKDFSIHMKKTPAIHDIELHSLNVTVSKFGRSNILSGYRVPEGYGDDWTFTVDCVVPTTTTIKYFESANYKFEVLDVATGLLQADVDVLPWNSGDKIHIRGSRTLPAPLNEYDAFYFVKGPSDNTFYVTDLYEEAIAADPTVFNYAGHYSGDMWVCSTFSTFSTVGKARNLNWRLNRLTDTIKETRMPITIQGVQGVIDFINGYAAYTKTQGFEQLNTDMYYINGNTGRLLSWQTEIEDCIDAIYSGLGVHNNSLMSNGNVQEVTVDVTDSSLKVLGGMVMPLGQSVYAFSYGLLPGKLTANKPYYVIPVSGKAGYYQLATSHDNAMNGIYVEIDTIGEGRHFIGAFTNNPALYATKHVVTPFRNCITIDGQKGVLSDVLGGPYKDIRAVQSIFDQFGDPIPENMINVLREDKRSAIVVDNNMIVDANGTDANQLFIGYAHLYFDGYEHVVLFEDYATSGMLMFNSFLGASVIRLLIHAQGKRTKTGRPAFGGYVMDATGNMIRNIEGVAEDMSNYFDVYSDITTKPYSPHLLATLGYENPEYLDHIGATEATKIQFWNQLLRHKGSRDSIAAFIQSSHFIDAKIDEVLAIKMGTFGNARDVDVIRANVNVPANTGDKLKIEFTTSDITSYPGFIPVNSADYNHWDNYPDLLEDGIINASTPFSFPLKDSKTVTYMYRGTWDILDFGTPFDSIAVDWNRNTLEDWEEIVNIITPQIKRVSPTAIAFPEMHWPTLHLEFILTVKLVDRVAFEPVTLIDPIKNKTISVASVWDPINGAYGNAIEQHVDLIAVDDPVNYEEDGYDWTDERLDTTWLDSSFITYCPYYNRIVYPTINDAMAVWGKMCDSSDPILYKWTVSDTAPDVTYARTVFDVRVEAESIDPDTEEPVIVETGRLEITRPALCTTYIYDGEHHYEVPIVNQLRFTIYINGKSIHDTDNRQYLPQYTTVESEFGGDLNAYIDSILDTPNSVKLGDQITFEIVAEDGDVFESVDDSDPDNIITTRIYVTEVPKFIVVPTVEGGVLTTKYYYWTRVTSDFLPGTNITGDEIISRLSEPDVNYIVPSCELTDETCNRLIMSIPSNLANEAVTLKLCIDVNHSLRTELRNINNNYRSMVYEQWLTFYPGMQSRVDRGVWDKLVESVVGYKVADLKNDQFVPVPSISRVMFDRNTGSKSRYGWRSTQTLADVNDAVNTIVGLFSNDLFDTQYIDKFKVLASYDLSSPMGRLGLMEEIYRSFPTACVNLLAYELLLESLTHNPDMDNIFKTSWLVLHGIKLIETEGKINGF